MRTNTLRRILALAIALSGAMIAGQENGSGVTAKITLPSGVTQVARLAGVGCSVAICSRAVIQARAKDNSLVKTPFASIAAIRETSQDDALFVLKDGRTRRLAWHKDSRVLYLTNPSGGTKKLDLAGVQAVEFLAASR